MQIKRTGFATACSLLTLVMVLSGCSKEIYGIRPDEPDVTKQKPCVGYSDYSKYAQKLQEAYHSRATQNRNWIYVAGILGLGISAVSGGLAVATSVSASTLGALAIGGGFAGGTFATINNDALAVSYTVAANSVDETLTNSRAMLMLTPGQQTPPYSDESCNAALRILFNGVSNARKHLEVARTDNAAGALARAKDQLNLLNKQVTALQEADITTITTVAEIIDLQPHAPSAAANATSVTLTVRANLEQGISLDDIKVAFGNKILNIDSIAKASSNEPNKFMITFSAPAQKPGVTEVIPEIILLGGKFRLRCVDGLVFTYP